MENDFGIGRIFVILFRVFEVLRIVVKLNESLDHITVDVLFFIAWNHEYVIK